MRLFAATLIALFTAQVFAQTPRPPQTMTMFLQGQYATLKRNLTGAAEKMPAEHFTFRPTPEVRTYSELFAHTIEIVPAFQGSKVPGLRTRLGTLEPWNRGTAPTA